ncbi:SPOR domain-containing protein [Ruegeria sp. Ofav3-42]|nr:SPOR domain-containing protein [Ruegeria sp. Ofav3-42]
MTETETAAASEDQPQADIAEAEATETEKPAKRKWWQRKKPAAAAGAATAAVVATDAAADATTEAATEATETVAEAAATPVLVDPEVAAPVEKPAKRKWWQKKKADEITETPLDPIAGAAAAIEASEPTPAASAAATTTTSRSSLSKPFVQVGTFGVEANANSAAAKIRRNGLPAEVRELKSDGKSVWRVVVGPASTRSERNAIQSDVKDLGFSDAFTVKN